MRIEPGEPEATRRESNAAYSDTLGELLEDAFPMETSDATLIWNGIPVSISYKYDLAVSIDEMEELITAISQVRERAFSIEWPSNTFHAHWHISLTGNDVQITARWEAVAQNREKELNKHPSIQMSSTSFLHEWWRLLSTVRTALIAAGYSVKDCAEWKRLEDLIVSCST